MDDRDLTDQACSLPCITLLTSNELLGLFFRHFLGEQIRLEVVLMHGQARPTQAPELYLLDADNNDTAQLASLLERLNEKVPVALLNIAPEQAEQLVERFPPIRGVFYTHATPEHLLEGIQVLLGGGDWLPRLLTEHLLGQWRRMRQRVGSKPSLTLREREILSLAGQGLSNAEIAERLNLSPHTIKSHMHNLLRKIGATSRAEAASLLRGRLRGRLQQPEACQA